mmetsp:Transcript_2586/g.9152  ORF Transcript_2586/g.9152 Transcript_2586/m.9152 type:complete len:166 (+) Transcript_2586:69-566(+)
MAGPPAVPAPKVLTLLMVVQGRRVLLGRKKRGFGAGYWNGFGGKVEPGETVLSAALRELEEEACIAATDATHRGTLTFHFDDNPQPWKVHVFHASSYEGEPSETEEMAPEWFDVDDIPFGKMWADDPVWYPHFLAGRLFEGEFYFTRTTTLLRGDARPVEALPPP